MVEPILYYFTAIPLILLALGIFKSLYDISLDYSYVSESIGDLLKKTKKFREDGILDEKEKKILVDALFVLEERIFVTRNDVKEAKRKVNRIVSFILSKRG